MAESSSSAGHHCHSYGIFWDIENCQIPHRADNVVQNLKQYIAEKYEAIVGQRPEPCAFVCACNAIKLDPNHVEGLNRSGVDILHVNPPRQNQNFKVVADDKLKECIQKFIEHHPNTKKSLVFVITGDVDFAPQIRTARRAGFQVILLYGLQTAKELMVAANEAHSFHDIVTRPSPSHSVAMDCDIPTVPQKPLSVQGLRDYSLTNNRKDPFDRPVPKADNVSSLRTVPPQTPIFIQKVQQTVAEIETQNQVRRETVRQTANRQIDEDKLKLFQEMTALDRHMALQILDKVNWDLEMAANVFFN